MKTVEGFYPKARIPYGTWASSPFPAWQLSPLANVDIGQCAGEAARYFLGRRGVKIREVDGMLIGTTIPWNEEFWGATTVSHCFGRRLPGDHFKKACATGMVGAFNSAGLVQTGVHDVVMFLAFDRTSNSPVEVVHDERIPARAHAKVSVWDSFGFDPSTGGSMIEAAGKTARKWGIDRRRVDEITYLRYRQYFDARERGFLDRGMISLPLLNNQGRFLGVVDKDTGVRSVTLDDLRAAPEIQPCVTPLNQTHASDGIAMLLVTTADKVRELSPQPDIDIQLIRWVETRANPGFMPEAPGIAVLELLKETGLTMADMAVVSNHNPFALADELFRMQMEDVTGSSFDPANMNEWGCPLVWGHPQGPTLTRVLIEGLELAVEKGGGYVLVFGCAAGDVGVAGLFHVDDRRKS